MPDEPMSAYEAFVEVKRLRTENEQLRAENDRLHLAYIEASNPGIDMEEVRRARAAKR